MICKHILRQLGPCIWLAVGARLFGRTQIQYSHISSVEMTSRYTVTSRPRCAPARFISRHPPASPCLITVASITFLYFVSNSRVFSSLVYAILISDSLSSLLC
ncbi:hypothetical protein AG1IA_04235 [Rhizoctonia solani AG-1 IA]|uniref:Uncharacterized protein n=1 Tax=Thanatephorus cucumeris (strain AG1-IA) TaxID=983506 RepID=L8WY88_THACA|nr:hypothetical protein AG1IA_04235 [Rhizoctonia solani AG-1 IA]